MKTSNKILLGAFILILLVLSGVHFALVQQYKSGHYTTSRDGSGKDSISLKPVKFVSLNGLDNITLVPSTSYQLQIDKNMPSSFKYYISGDTLVVIGDTSSAIGGNNGSHRRISDEIILHIPAVTLIRAENTSLGIAGTLDSAEAGTTRLDLIKSKVSFENHFRDNDSPQYFGDLLISAKEHSEIEFGANRIHFNTFSCNLVKSSFRDNDLGDIKKLTITTDDSSSVQISGTNLQKLKTAATE